MRCTLRNKSTLLSTLLVLAVVFGKSRGTQLDIMPDQNGLMICNSSVVFTCTLKAAPPIAMTWQLNNTDVAECTATGCDPPFGLPSHHTTTFVSGTGGTVTELHINPVKLSDNYVIACTDGDKASIQTHVKVEALPLDVTKINHTDKTDVTVLTSCIFSPLSSVKFKLQNSKTGEILNIINNNEYIIPSDTEQCTNAENPNCGGNSTARAKVQFTISTQATGTPTDLQIITVQSDVSLTTPSIIGSFKLKDNTTQTVPTTESLSSQSPTHTTSTTRQMSTSASSTITDITTDKLSTTGSPDKQSATSLNEPFIYLIVGCVVLIVVTVAFMANVGYIIYRKRQKEIKTLDESDAVSNAVTNAGSQVYNAIEQRSDLQTEQTSEQL